MKTTHFTKILVSLMLVFFSASGSIAANYSVNEHDGATTASVKSADAKKVSAAITTKVENSFQYLRFEVAKFMKHDAVAEDAALLDYLHFDANVFAATNTPDLSVLPATNEFDYLRFDANKYISPAEDTNVEMPVNAFEYLRFDATKYKSNPVSTDLPEAE